MKVGIIINGISRRKNFAKEILPALRQHFEVEAWETRSENHAIELAQKANADILISAGGDGTLNQVLNGVMRNEKQPVIGILPLGTANDFAHACGLRANAQELIDLIKNNSVHPTDAGKIDLNDENGNKITRYFLNTCSVGMGPDVADAVRKDSRRWGTKITYFKAVLKVFFTEKPKTILITDGEWKWDAPLRLAAIANTKTMAGDFHIAPDNKIDDGIFSVYIAGALSVFQFVQELLKLVKGKKSASPLVRCHQASRCHLQGDALIEADGELQGRLPASVEVLAGRINVLRPKTTA